MGTKGEKLTTKALIDISSESHNDDDNDDNDDDDNDDDDNDDDDWVLKKF